MVEPTTIIVFEIAGDNHNQVNQRPDAETSEGEQLEDAANNAPGVEAMYAERAQKLAQQYCCEPVLLWLHCHHLSWIWILRLLRLWLPLRRLLLWIAFQLRPWLSLILLPLSLLLLLRLSRIDRSVIVHYDCFPSLSNCWPFTIRGRWTRS